MSTFLVPLAILAVVGWNELQRSGELAHAALEREGQIFVKSARSECEAKLDAVLPELLEKSKKLLEHKGLVRTTLELRAQPEFAALRSIVMLDEQGGVSLPKLPLYNIYLPLARDTQRGSQFLGPALQQAELLMQHEQYADAIRGMQRVLERLQEANPGPDRSSAFAEMEVKVRFRLGVAMRKVGYPEDARDQLQQVQTLVKRLSPQWNAPMSAMGLLAETTLAEMGTAEDRLQLLRAIAGDEREVHADGLLSAIALRLAALFPANDPHRDEVDGLLREEECRAAISAFATSYEEVVKYSVIIRRLRHTNSSESSVEDAFDVEQLTSTIRDPDGGALANKAVLVCIRPATQGEAAKWHCASIALHLDLPALLGDVWRKFAGDTGTFVLAVQDSEDVPIVPPPPTVPADFVVPTQTTSDFTLSAYPADPAKLATDAEASARNRKTLMLVLFVTALGGALWSLRSVSREAELAAMKVDLVSRVSHELKTPLALVRMYGETLSLGRARDGTQAAEFGGIIAREAERLTALIQRILDFSRQQAGTLTYEAEPIDLAELLRSVVEAYSPHLESRGVMLIDSLPHGIRVHCDANACESAIVNLLENAAKYGPEGAAEHEVDLVLEKQAGQAVIEVRDRGRGIPTAELDRVFEGFFRASNSGEVRGAGLGLSLVRHFARAHGGEIQALPRDGGGTVMRLTLPLAAAATAGTEPRPTQANAGAKPALDS